MTDLVAPISDPKDPDLRWLSGVIGVVLPRRG
jgi:hypothetical protein